MASYKQAVEWIALNDAVGDTPVGMTYREAFEAVEGMVSACLVADLWNKTDAQVAQDILRARGFRTPRNFRPIKPDDPNPDSAN